MFKEKSCVSCNASFIPKGPAGKYCQDCVVPSSSREYHRLASQKHLRKMGREVGVGSGKSSKNRGPNHPQYKDGWTTYFKHRAHLKATINQCQRCSKDLSSASKWEWVCHHKDHDRSNSDISNLEILCKRCHQIEHECWKAFEGATTISQESTPKRAEAPDTPSG